MCLSTCAVLLRFDCVNMLKHKQNILLKKKADNISPCVVGLTNRLLSTCTRKTVEETVGREPLRERTLRHNLFGASPREAVAEAVGLNPCGNVPFGTTSSAQLALKSTLNWTRGSRMAEANNREPTIVLGAWRLKWPKPTIGKPLSPLERGSRVAETNNREPSSPVEFECDLYDIMLPSII